MIAAKMTSAMAALVASMTTTAVVFNVMVSGLRFMRASLDDLFVARRRMLRLLQPRHKKFVGAEDGTCCGRVTPPSLPLRPSSRECHELTNMDTVAWREVSEAVHMNVSLTPELEALINDKVGSGLYQTASEVIREALSLLKQRDDLAGLRTDVQVGLDQLTRGEGRDYDEVAGRALAERVKATGRATRTARR